MHVLLPRSTNASGDPTPVLAVTPSLLERRTHYDLEREDFAREFSATEAYVSTFHNGITPHAPDREVGIYVQNADRHARPTSHISRTPNILSPQDNTFLPGHVEEVGVAQARLPDPPNSDAQVAEILELIAGLVEGARVVPEVVVGGLASQALRSDSPTLRPPPNIELPNAHVRNPRTCKPVYKSNPVGSATPPRRWLQLLRRLTSTDGKLGGWPRRGGGGVAAWRWPRLLWRTAGGYDGGLGGSPPSRSGRKCGA